jgi:hypothetical protein
MVVPFPVEQVAEGLALWAQLALIDAAQELERVSARLPHMASEAAYEAREREEAMRGGTGQDDEDDEPWAPDGEAWREVVYAIEGSAPGEPRRLTCYGAPSRAGRRCGAWCSSTSRSATSTPACSGRPPPGCSASLPRRAPRA